MAADTNPAGYFATALDYSIAWPDLYPSIDHAIEYLICNDIDAGLAPTDEFIAAVWRCYDEHRFDSDPSLRAAADRVHAAASSSDLSYEDAVDHYLAAESFAHERDANAVWCKLVG